jgi:hypothetical protein
MLPMRISEINSPRPKVQRHPEVALSLVQVPKPIATLPLLKKTVMPLKPVNPQEFAADWLDTPAAHCWPLDDY